MDLNPKSSNQFLLESDIFADAAAVNHSVGVRQGVTIVHWDKTPILSCRVKTVNRGNQRNASADHENAEEVAAKPHLETSRQRVE